MSFICRRSLRSHTNFVCLETKRQCMKPRILAAPTRNNVSQFYSTASEARAKAAVGPFTYKAAAVFLGVGSGLLLYFKSEKQKVEKMLKEKEAEKQKTQAFGKPKLGGEYTLTDASNGKPFGSGDLKGKFSLIYFGFTHCPDICPDELDKMSEVVDAVKKDIGDNVLVPVFITCDPRRDTMPVVKEYVKDFHKDLVGLTGTEEEIRRVAKLFRVYVSSPPDISEGDDYLVDHSIFFYLMDPEGNFLDCYGQNSEASAVTQSFKNYYNSFIQNGGKIQDRYLTIENAVPEKQQ
ncbi:SCO1/SenC-domain-containing protein [Gilbertella persicaria]|uniref:SCO1/SenC-domain-containing protein n=1 Tax=Gilbertella persicaria TaxID=101096 RepID=UPI0022206B5F|nr:SCO1/SenC-domain-containing protein [Gilbertella persicaria]KAI8048057.1 SCO1/SenC-domain-containing protein [Gilbertella persicaria]